MKKALLFLAAGLMATSMSACFSTNTSDFGTLPTVVTKPAVYKPKYKLDDKTTEASATVHSVFNFITWGVSKVADNGTLDNSMFSFIPNPMVIAKSGAVYNACEAAKKDALVGTTYEVVTEDYFVYKKIKATVKGYGAQLEGVSEVK